MIRSVDFEVNDSFANGKWVGMYAITVNLIKRIRKLKGLSYNRLQLILQNGEPDQTTVDWENSRNIRVHLYLDFNKIVNCREPEQIKLAYKLIFDSLRVLWKLRGWQKEDLDKIYSQIVEENYEVSAVYGNAFHSRDKQHKVELYCKLMPDYAEHYVRFLNKKNQVLREVFYLKGGLNPIMFFGFFNSIYWRDNEHFFIVDMNREIFYIFQVSVDNFSIEFKPLYNSIEDLKNYVRAFDWNVSAEEHARLMGLPYRPNT